MKPGLLICLLLHLSVQSSVAQFKPFLYDGFEDTTKGIDISALIIRNGETKAMSAFEYVDKTDGNGLTYSVVAMNSIGETAGVCCTYDNGSYIAHNCIDYVFPNAIYRSDNDTIKIEFDGIWDKESDGKGEASKLIVYLMYQYPGEGPDFGVYNDLANDHYGKPAYQLWLLNGSNHAFMSYGGGKEKQGSFITLPANDPQYWLPGFTEKKVTEGEIDTQDPYPASAYARVLDKTTVSAAEWKHYTWLIAPERLSLFWRDAGKPESEDELVFFMEVPEDEENIGQINEAHGTFETSMPLLYEWFDEVNAVRFFINKNSYFSNIKISKTGEPLNTFVEFRRRKETIMSNEETYDLEFDIFNESLTDTTYYQIELVQGNERLINGFTSGQGFFIPGDNMSSIIPLTLTPDDDNNADTLVFEITKVTGGNLATMGTIIIFQLIIETTSTNEGTMLDALNVYPNPTYRFINIENVSGQFDIEIYDTAGRLLVVKSVRHDEVVDLQGLESGMYIFKLLNGSNVKTMKVKKM